MHIVEHNMLWY